MRQTTSTTSTMTRTLTRASCTTCEHALRARSLRLTPLCRVTCASWLKVFLSLISYHPHGTIKYVIDSIQDNTELPSDPHEDQVPQTSVKVIAARSKAKENHKRGKLLTHQVSYRCTKEDGLTLSHQNKILLRTIFRRK